MDSTIAPTIALIGDLGGGRDPIRSGGLRHTQVNASAYLWLRLATICRLINRYPCAKTIENEYYSLTGGTNSREYFPFLLVGLAIIDYGTLDGRRI